MTRRGGRAFALATGIAFLLGCSGGKPTVPDAGPPPDAGGCESRADCPSGEVCLVPLIDGGVDGGMAQPPVDGGFGMCTFCTANGQCLPQELCAADSGLCTFLPGWGDACSKNSDCPLGQTPEYCVQGLCQPQSQVTFCQRGRCGSQQRCNQTNNVCEEDLGCLSDQDCTATQVCNLGTRECEARCDPMDAGAVCDPVQQCVNDRCVDCTTDAQCGPGLTCDVVAGRCSAPGICYSNANCPPGQVCNPASQTCGDPPPPCTSNNNCPNGFVCDVTLGQCTPGTCEPDAFSPNQTLATAAPIVTSVSYTNLTLCGPSDEDWYSIALNSGDTIQVTVNVDATGAGYSFVVSLFDGTGALVGPAGLPGALVLNRTVNQTATYYLQMTDGDTQAAYGFYTQVAHGPPCTSTYPNQSLATALPIDGGLGSTILCPGLSDYYSIAYDGVSLTAMLSFDVGIYFGLNMLAANGVTVLASADGGTNGSNEVSVSGALDGGLIYLQIYGNGVDPASYSLGISQ